jgi:hypothetical protein
VVPEYDRATFNPKRELRMDSATGFITLMAALSLAVERTVEVVKGFVPFLNQPSSDPKADARRGALVRVLAAVCGGFVAAGAQSQINATAHFLSYQSMGFMSYVIIGLLTCGGSAFWNHVLDILQKYKNKPEAKEVEAIVQKAIAAKAGK